MNIQEIIHDEKKKKFLITGLGLFFILFLLFLFMWESTPKTAQNEDPSKYLFPSPKEGSVLTSSHLVAPIIAVSSDTNTVAPGQPAVISWSSLNATSCSDANGNTLLASSSISISPTENYTFDVLCTNEKGTTMESVTVAVTTAPIINLSAYPNPVEKGKSSSILWHTINTTRCSDPTGKTLRLSDSFAIEPTKPYTFEINCVGPNGTGKNSVTVTIAIPGKNSTGSGKVTGGQTTSTTTGTNSSNTGKQGPGTSTGSANIKLTADKAHVAYGETANVSWEIKDAINCSAISPTGVEIVNAVGGQSIILRPGQRVPEPPGTIPLTGNININVLAGKTKATIIIQCEGPDGKKTERSITITSEPKTVAACVNFKRPTLTMFADPKEVESGSPSKVTWTTKCADTCTVQADPWGELIGYVDASNVTDFDADKDYNIYYPMGNTIVPANTTGGVRVTPGTADPMQPQTDSGANGFLSSIVASSLTNSTITLKCTNTASSTPYSITKSINVPVIVHPGGCSTGILGMGCGFW
ncbi:MAG: hypothetical protein WAY88_00825 [Minisyncoccia bacterium]